MRSFFLLLLVAMASMTGLHTSYGQKLKNKEVIRLLESTPVQVVEVLAASQFIPDVVTELDVKVTLTNGQELLASTYPAVWDKLVTRITGAELRAKGGLLSNGKGAIKPFELPRYYRDTTITLTVSMGDKEDTHELKPSYCINGIRFSSSGDNGSQGSNGTKGSTGSAGRDGRNGYNGDDAPDITLTITEEEIGGKIYLIVTYREQKYRFDPSCSTIKVTSKGGDGGEGGEGGDGGDGRKQNNQFTDSGGRGGRGGDGGNGGDGGDIILVGVVAEKYKDNFVFDTDGGRAGYGGRGGNGGNGRSSGSSGTRGTSGYSGSRGQVIFKTN
jgi:hypothetical protein